MHGSGYLLGLLASAGFVLWVLLKLGTVRIDAPPPDRPAGDDPQPVDGNRNADGAAAGPPEPSPDEAEARETGERELADIPK